MNCPACQRPSDASSRTCAGCGAPLPVVAGSLIAGRYLVLERLGEGGMGTVFKARDRALEATVALKVVSPLLTAWFVESEDVGVAVDGFLQMAAYGVGFTGATFAYSPLLEPGTQRRLSQSSSC